jgi:hypothetical protein
MNAAFEDDSTADLIRTIRNAQLAMDELPETAWQRTAYRMYIQRAVAELDRRDAISGRLGSKRPAGRRRER